MQDDHLELGPVLDHEKAVAGASAVQGAHTCQGECGLRVPVNSPQTAVLSMRLLVHGRAVDVVGT